MNKIKIIILRKNRNADFTSISPDAPFFKRRGHLYTIPKEAICMAHFEYKTNNPRAELIYVEGDPIPISLEDTLVPVNVLSNLVIRNALKATGKPKTAILELVMDYAKNPGKIFLLVIALIVFIAFLSSLLM